MYAFNSGKIYNNCFSKKNYMYAFDSQKIFYNGFSKKISLWGNLYVNGQKAGERLPSVGREYHTLNMNESL